MDVKKIFFKIVLKILTYTRISIEFTRNIILPLALFSPVFIFAKYFQEFYLSSGAVQSPLTYVIGFWAGAFPIAVSVYLGYMKKAESPSDNDKIFTSKVSASIIGSAVLIAGVRIIPPFLNRFGLGINPDVVSRIALDLIYLLPVTLIFIAYRNFTLYSDISSERKIKRKFDDRKEEYVEQFDNIDSDSDVEEIQENQKPLTHLIPDIEWGLEKGELKDAIVNGNLMILALGAATYLIESYLINLSLKNLVIFLIVLAPILKYGLIAIQYVITLIAPE